MEAPETGKTVAANSRRDLPPAVPDDGELLPEIPVRVADEIASWQRPIGNARRDQTGLFYRASADLMRLADRAAEPATWQVIVDRLQNMAEVAGLDADEAQAIVARAAEAPPDVHPLNG